MFVIKKAITPFILPPGIFITLLFILGLWALRRKNRMAAVSIFGVGLGLWLTATVPVAHMLMRPLETGLNIPAYANADVIIVLGGGSYDRALDLSGIGTPGPATIERMVTAARLHWRTQAPIMVSGGKVIPTDTPVALLTERFLIDLGIPARYIIVDLQSRDTRENAIYSKKLCDHYGFKRPVVVTSGFHIKRARHCFEKAGLKATFMPCGLTTWPNRTYHWRHFLPSAGSLNTTAAALHEWVGLMYYRLAY